MFDIPERPPATDGWNRLEVVRRRRRSRGPFQRPGVPRIVTGWGAVFQGIEQVPHDDQVTGCLDQGAETGQLVPQLPMAIGRVRENPTSHPQDAGYMHGTKR